MIATLSAPVEGVEHEHRHNTPHGWRSFRHVHPWPRLDGDENAARRHRHPNGEHSHAHGHARYLEERP